jgi:hypothetical protein
MDQIDVAVQAIEKTGGSFAFERSDALTKRF